MTATVDPLPALVIPQATTPAGAAFSAREAAMHRALLVANGYQATLSGYRRAAADPEPVLRTAAFQLLACEPGAPSEDDRAQLEQGLADPWPAVRAFAAFGLDRLHPGRGLEVLRGLAAGPLTFGDYAPLIAAALLALRGDDAGFSTVQDAMQAGEPRVVVARLWPFARLGHPGVWSLYEQALATDDIVVWEQVLAQLRELAAPAAAPIVARFASRIPEDHPWNPTARDLLRALTLEP